MIRWSHLSSASDTRSPPSAIPSQSEKMENKFNKKFGNPVKTFKKNVTTQCPAQK